MNTIQLLHLNEINMRFYGAEYNNIERDEVLWSRVQQYWTRRSRVQYYCILLHKTSYWSSSSVVIVLLHTQGRRLLCYSTEAGGLGVARRRRWVTGTKLHWGIWGAKSPPPINDFEQFRVYLGPVSLQNSHKNMSQLYTIVHS
jgi:hypothetical protein